jgi:protein involved in polysaccharide export with SLBB domain
MAQTSDVSLLQRLLQGANTNQQFPVEATGQNSYPTPFLPNTPSAQPQSTSQNSSTVRQENISNVEKLFSVRSGVRLAQFGYNLLGGASSVGVPTVGAVSDSFVLGPGDEMVVTLRGQENSTYNIQVGRDGMVILPRLRPMRAAGLTLGDFRTQLQQQVAQAFQATSVFLSLGQLRQISVTVIGNVPNPGVRVLSALSSPLDALMLSGGVKKSGSLRRVQIIRDGKTIPLDLYGVVEGRASSSSLDLRDGDRIVVPALGPVFAVTGLVRRPAIFELAAGSNGISVASAISLAGGLQLRGKYHIQALTTLRDGRTQLVNLSERSIIHDSDILMIQAAASERVGDIEYSGPLPLNGQYSVSTTPSLKALLTAPGALGDHPYMLFGLVVRKNPKTLINGLLAFAPVRVISGSGDIKLQSHDIVRVFTNTEMSWLARQAQAYEHRMQATASLGQIQDTVARENASSDRSSDLFGGHASGSSRERTALRLAELDVLSDEFRLRPENIDFAAGARQSSFPAGASPSADSSTQSPSPSLSGTDNPYQLRADAGSAPSALAQPAGTTSSANVNSATEANGTSDSSKNLYAPSPQPSPNPNSLYDLANAVPSTPEGVTLNSITYNFEQLGRQLGVDPLVLAEFFLDNRADLQGAVRNPGTYLAADGITLGDLVAAAGGTARWVDNSGVEMVTTQVNPSVGAATTERKLLKVSDQSLDTITVHPHDQFRFNEVFNDLNQGTVSIRGEVRFPGTYQILRGDRLSSILARAGGLTDNAYPYGAVFLRASQARIERDNLELQVQTIRRENLNSADALQQINTMVADIQKSKTLGRITIQADPAVLASHPGDDLLLENADVLYIPQRPSSITVVGEVQKPGAYLFKPGLSADDYIDLAGGVARYADEDYAFVVFPDGKTRKIDSSWINLNSDKIPPGSVIVIPRDLNPLTWHQFITDSTSFISQWILAAASLAVLSKN